MAKTVMIFGAGASIPFFSPPLNTCTITRQVQDKKIWKSLLQRYAATTTGNLNCPVELGPILSLIKKARDVRQCLNFEQLIEMVDKFSSFALGASLPQNSGIGILSKHQHDLFKFLGADEPAQQGHYWPVVPFLFRQIIAEAIGKWDSQFRSKRYFDLVNRQSELLSAQKKRRNLSVYTFNYDDVLPQTITLREIPLLETGFHSGGFDSKKFLKAPSILAFLHGHARWSLDNIEMRCFNSISEANCWRLDHLFNLGLDETIDLIDGPRAFDFNTYLTTGQDKEPSFSRNPYSAYYHRLASDLMRADSVIIIGYSLNDPHVDRLLLNFAKIRPEKNKILVVGRWEYNIDPMFEFTNIGSPLQHLLSKFDIKGIPVTESLELPDTWGERIRATNRNGYGFFCPQIWIYKNGYRKFLSEWQTVLDEWQCSQDP